MLLIARRLGVRDGRRQAHPEVGFMGLLDVIAVSPAGKAEPALAIAASRGGARRA